MVLEAGMMPTADDPAELLPVNEPDGCGSEKLPPNDSALVRIHLCALHVNDSGTEEQFAD